jgi:hypothetical protein
LVAHVTFILPSAAAAAEAPPPLLPADLAVDADDCDCSKLLAAGSV